MPSSIITKQIPTSSLQIIRFLPRETYKIRLRTRYYKVIFSKKINSVECIIFYEAIQVFSTIFF